MSEIENGQDIPIEEIKMLLEKYGLTYDTILNLYPRGLNDEEKKFIEDYGLTETELTYLFFKSLGLKIETTYRDNGFYIDEKYYHSYLSILDEIKLRQLLSSCTEGTFEISGIINNPKKGEVRNTVKKISIQPIFLSKLLEHNKINEIYFERKTEEELNSLVINLSDLKESLQGLNINRMIGKSSLRLLNELDHILFKDWNKRKKYCFIYDICVYSGVCEDIGEEFKGSIGKMKENWIKSRINSYKKWEKENFNPEKSVKKEHKK